MAHRTTLTERQLTVLRWIDDGCPDDVFADTTHRISAAALRNRGLVQISGRGRTWSARITDSGREYLKQANGPSPPLPRHANTSVTQQLVDDVVAAGGTLRVSRSHWRPGQVDYANRARLAEQYGKVPRGKQLVVTVASQDELQIELVDVPTNGSGHEPMPVPVPTQVARYHPVVRGFRDRSERHEVSRGALKRTQLLLQGFALEAERRGYQVGLAPEPERTGYGNRSEWRSNHHGHVVITVGDYSAAIRVHEEGLQTRPYWKQRNWDYFRHTHEWTPQALGAYEARATGRLQMQLVTGYSQRQSAWADRRSASLEDQLPDLLREVEIRAKEDEDRRREAERQEAERQRSWEAAMARARELHAEHRRGEALLGEVSRWQRAQGVRSYCRAAEEAHPEAAQTQEWIAWARQYADSLDPLRSAPSAPPHPEKVSPEDLRPFLNGWDPYGPERGRW